MNTDARRVIDEANLALSSVGMELNEQPTLEQLDMLYSYDQPGASYHSEDGGKN